MMGFAEDKFYDYLRKNLILLERIRVDELLIPLSACLSSATVEKLNAYVRNQGNRKTVMDFYLDLSRSDNWVRHFIDALRHCEHTELADKFDAVYSSFRPIPRTPSSPRSLPPSVNYNNRQPSQENSQRYSSLPGPVPPPSQATQPASSPESSQRLNQIQPEQEMIQSSPSHQNQEFRSLPTFPREPPAPSKAPISHNVSAPIRSDTRILEDDSVSKPVPETSPYQATPPEGDVEDESSDSRNAQTGHDPLPSVSLSPSLKETKPMVSIRPYNLEKTEKLPEQDPPYKAIYSGQEDHERKEQQEDPSVLHKEKHSPEQPALASGDLSVRSKVVAGVQRNGQAANGAVNNAPDRSPASYRPVNREAQENPKRQRPPNQWVDNVPDRRAENDRPVHRETAQVEPKRERPPNDQVENAPDKMPAGYHPENRKAAPVETKKERPPNEQVDNAPDRSTASHRPVNRGTALVEPNRERPPNEQESSCRPYSSDEFLSKPRVLLSTPDCAAVTGEESPLLSRIPDFQISRESVSSTPRCGETPLLSENPKFEISYDSERSESGNASGRSSTSATQEPPVSTPKGKSMQDRRSPEENDFMFDSRSSPRRNRGLDNSSSKQPEENSYESKSVSHFRLHYEERPEEDLLESNDNALRNRQRKTSSTSEPYDQKDTKKTERRDHERAVLISITVASLCLSLYLLWKSRNN